MITLLISYFLFSNTGFTQEVNQEKFDAVVRLLPAAETTFSFPVRYQWIGGVNAGVGCSYNWDADPTGAAFNLCAVYISYRILDLGTLPSLAALAHELSHLRLGHLEAKNRTSDPVAQRTIETAADYGGLSLFCRIGLGRDAYVQGFRMLQEKFGDMHSLYHYPLNERIELLGAKTCKDVL